MDHQPAPELTPAVDSGLDHYPPHIRDAVEGRPLDLAAEPVGNPLERRAGAFFELLKRSREHRIIMAAARRAGEPQSWADERWEQLDDVAWEIAYDAYKSWARDKACPNCGTDPDLVIDPITGRVLEDGPVKVEKRGCEVCATIGRRTRDIDQAERDMLGTYWTTAHRGAGDPFVDDGGFEFDAGGMAPEVDLSKGGYA